MSFGETLIKIVQTILIMSATGSIIALLLFALKPIVKNHLPKNTQYYLWVLVLVAFLVPFSTFVSLPFATPMTAVQEVIDQNIISTDERYEKIAREQHNKSFESLQTNEQVKIIYENNELDYNRLLAIPSSCVITIFLITIFQYLSFCKKLYYQRIPAKENEIAMLNQLHTGKRKPHLYRNSLAPTPMLIGMFHPIIYLPNRDYSDRQLKNILLHELTHLLRCDVAIKWIASIVVYIHWFNPVAYLVRREVDKVCELACDETVITHLDNEGKQSYGDTLIEMAAEMKKSRVIVSTTMCEEKKTLKERLSAIMNSKKPTKLVIQASCVLLGIVFCAVILFGSSSNYNDCSTPEGRELRLREIHNLGVTTTISQEIIIDGYVISGYETNDRYGLAIFEPVGEGIYKFQTNDNRFKVDGGISFVTAIINHQLYSLFWANKPDLGYVEVRVTADDRTWAEPITLDAKNNKIMYMDAPSKNYSFSVSLFDINGNPYKTVSDITSTALQNSEDELLSAMLENTVPDGLTLEITSAAQDDAEFLLSNMTEHIVQYGYVNRVERYIDGDWKPAILETKAIFPEDPESLQAGERLYGMAAWVRDNTELSPGNYRFLMLINVRDGDLPAYPVVLEAPFEITE